MRKLFVLILAIGVIGSTWEPALAGKSYSSGRSSSSGGSRSSGFRSSSSGSSWKPSSSAHGRSYSSGGSGRSYSSGSSRPSPPATKSSSGTGGTARSPAPGPAVPAKTYSSGSTGGGKSYSPSWPSSGRSASSNTAASGTSASSSPAGRSYSLGTNQRKDDPSRASPPAGKDFASSSPPSAKPHGSSVFTDLSRAQAVEESRTRFQQATAPKPVYRDAAGGEHKIDQADQKVQTLRKTVTPDKYANRPARADEFYGPPPAIPGPTVFRDPFGPLFYLWLLQQASADRRAEWAYHHRPQIDEARWTDMTRRDPQLEARVEQLEAAGRPRDPNYVPPELANDPDLMYSDEYLAAVWNPQPPEARGPPAPLQPNPWDRFVAHGPHPQTPHDRSGFTWTGFFGVLAILGLGAFVIWLVLAKQSPQPGKTRDQGKKTMPTLFQIVKNALFGRSAAERPDQTSIYNPLSARCGAFVAIDAIDFRGKNYRIVEIQQYDHKVGGKRFQLANYVLRFDEEVVRLRAVPFENRWKVLLLSLYDDLAYDEGLHNVVRDDTLKFVVDDPDENLHEEYWRVEDVRESYKAEVTVLRGKNSDAPPEVSRAQVEYWDYWRDTLIDGVKTTQYLYVEMNAETGWFQIWRGTETEPERILVT